MLMTVPPELPNSALKKLVWTLNSSTTSTVGVYLTSVTPPLCSIPVSGLPAISTSEALFRTPLETKLVPDPVGTIPGASRIKPSGLRVLSGMLMIIWLSTTCPRVAEVVLSKAAELCTSTVVDTAPTLSSISTVDCCCTSSRISGSVAFLKPAASTVRAYLAAGKVVKIYRPAEIGDSGKLDVAVGIGNRNLG